LLYSPLTIRLVGRREDEAGLRNALCFRASGDAGQIPRSDAGLPDRRPDGRRKPSWKPLRRSGSNLRAGQERSPPSLTRVPATKDPGCAHRRPNRGDHRSVSAGPTAGLVLADLVLPAKMAGRSRSVADDPDRSPSPERGRSTPAAAWRGWLVCHHRNGVCAGCNIGRRSSARALPT
jgi:hypothetical protein